MADPNRITDVSRFWRYVEPFAALDACWLWTGAVDRNGYGRFRYKDRQQAYDYAAHRIAYHLLVGPIPDGLVTDHLCRNRLCVNPDHLEPVTNRENIRRGLRMASPGITDCPHGHPWSENLRIRRNGYRVCRACERERLRAWAMANRDRMREHQRAHEARRRAS